MRFLKFKALPLVHAVTLLLIHSSSIQGVMGANFAWDITPGTNGAQDGAGTWVEAGSNWFDESNNLQNQTWSNAAGNTAVFGAGGTPGTVTVSGTVNTNGMIFRGVAANTAYTLAGGTIALATGSTISIADGASSLAGRLTINSALSGNNIIMEKAAGSTALALVTLGGTNTLSGTFTLNSADAGGLFVQANSFNVLPSGSLTMVNVGTNVTLVAAGGGTWAVPFTLQGTGAGGRGAIRFDGASTTTTGAITLAGNTLLTQNTAAATTLINSNIGESGGSRSLTLGTQGTSTGTIALGGNNTFTGGLVIEVTNVRIDNAGALNSTAPNIVTFTSTTAARSLSLNGFSVTIAGLSTSATTVSVRNASATAATLTLNNTANTAFAGALTDGAGGGALSVVKNGALSQALSGANTFTGGLTLNAGGLNINSATALGATVSTFTINGGTVGNTSGGVVINANNNAMVWNADFAASLSNSLDLGTGAVSLGTTAGTSRTVNVSGAGALTVGGAISDGTTANAVTKTGTGLMILGGNSTYTGVTTVSGGNLRITNGGALGSTAAGTTVAPGSRLQLDNNITVNGESLITAYLENVGGNNTWNGTIQCALGTALTFDSAAGNLAITGNVNAADTAAANHTLNLTGAGNGEISGVISNTFGFGKTGTGTWILSGANNYTSATNVSDGVLQVGKAGVGQTGTGIVTVSSTTGTGRLSGTGI
ncbi:MAG: beta strand repeat-containing protein, partial [Roseimicrobium sp.]